MTKRIRVLVVDDHAHAREAVRDILQAAPEFEIVAEATGAEEAIALTEQHMPDLILMDIKLPGMDGLEATKRIKARFPYVKIVIMTVSGEVTHLFEAIKRGAQGYLVKQLPPDVWVSYLQAVAVDEAPLSKELALCILRELTEKRAAPPADDGPLSKREREILHRVAQGKTNREIAEELGISEYTVKNHLKNILNKLHLENRVQLARYAYERGWMP